RRENVIDVGLLEHCVREDLNRNAARAMVVTDPIKLVITNYPEGKTETLTSEINPEDPDAGLRELPFGRELYIERDDFMEVPEKKYFRLGPGLMARLKSAYIVKCESFEKDAQGNITTLHCTYVPESKSGHDTSGLQVKGVIHWVHAPSAVPVEVRLYDRLFKVENPASEEGDFKDYINPDSLHVIPNAVAEPWLAKAKQGDHFQFMRKGYFAVDPDSANGKLVFNRTVSLKDSWGKK
ncbi:MAG: glutamine--tRNA ligase, partial [Bacteroidia bacterium]